MENPMRCGDYRSSTSPNHAKQFTFKQARNLLRINKKGCHGFNRGIFTWLIWIVGKRKAVSLNTAMRVSLQTKEY